MRNLSPEEFQVRRQAQDELARAIKARATYRKQRSKNKAIRESDSNTAFHHAQATQRLRHNFIRLVRVDGNDIVNHEGKTAALTAFFSSIVGAPGTSADANLDSLYEGRSQPSNSLTDSFSEPETKQALWAMNRNSAPAPMGLDLRSSEQPGQLSACRSCTSWRPFIGGMHSLSASIDPTWSSFRRSQVQSMWMPSDQSACKIARSRF